MTRRNGRAGGYGALRAARSPSARLTCSGKAAGKCLAGPALTVQGEELADLAAEAVLLRRDGLDL
jgi:hypothetical protein